MAYPVKQLKDRFSKVTLEGKPVKVARWCTNEEVKEIIDVLKLIDQGYDMHIRSRGTFKSKMSILYEFFKLTFVITNT